MIDQRPRYVVGIDLGTTNCVVCAVELKDGSTIERLVVPQLTQVGEIGERDYLPSALLTNAASEEIGLDLEWRSNPRVVGHFARERGVNTPGQSIQSAKSWLSHRGVDREAPILPWDGQVAASEKLSPVQASTEILRYIKDVWDHNHQSDPLSEQDVVITVPASFDDTARRLTVRAAKDAGFPKSLYLIEEPQAAFYAQMETGSETLDEGDLVLIIDIGGGTSDFTLIKVDKAPDARAKFERVAVGRHLLLGGDNMDLLLAHTAERKMLGRSNSLSSRQIHQLVASCREMKEKALAESGDEVFRITLPGSGRRLISSVQGCEFSKNEVLELTQESFFPKRAFEESIVTERALSLSAMGLPFEKDPVITNHLGEFLRANEAHGFPTHVLLNGGVFEAKALQKRILQIVNDWAVGKAPSVSMLAAENLNGAVARGAVVYGLARRGVGERVGGGINQNYLIGVEKRNKKGKRKGSSAVCILPKGTPIAREVLLNEQAFELVSGRPIRMTVYTENTEKIDHGQRIAFDRGHRLPSIRVQTVVGSDLTAEVVPVRLSAMMSELGLLELRAKAIDRELEFEFEFDTNQDDSAEFAIDSVSRSLDQSRGDRHAIESTMLDVFGPPNRDADPKAIRHLVRNLEQHIGAPRDNWGLSESRGISDLLIKGLRRRRRSDRHEQSFWYLVGFTLRPGRGDHFDDWRVSQLLPLFDEGLQFHQRLENWDSWWIAWRRISAGLPTAAQLAIYQKISGWLERFLDDSLGKKDRMQQPNEAFRLLASLEQLDGAQKGYWGDRFLKMSKQSKFQHFALWCLSRLGAREPLYAGAEKVVSTSRAKGWIEELLQPSYRGIPFRERCLVSIGRCTGDRARDLDPSERRGIADELVECNFPQNLIQAVLAPTPIEIEETKTILGDSLPEGLRLII